MSTESERASMHTPVPAEAVTAAHIAVLHAANWLCEEDHSDGTWWFGYDDCLNDINDDDEFEFTSLDLTEDQKQDPFAQRLMKIGQGSQQWPDPIWFVVFQDMLSRLPEDQLEYLEYEGAYTSTRLAPGSNGGFIVRIYRNRIESRSTSNIRNDLDGERTLIPALRVIQTFVAAAIVNSNSAANKPSSADLAHLADANAVLCEWIANIPC